MGISDFSNSLKQKLSSSQKASLFFVLLFILILPLSLAAILIPTQLKNRATEPITPPITPPTIFPSPLPTAAPVLVCDPTCYFQADQCSARITPKPGYSCQTNPNCSDDCTPEKIALRGNNYWCVAYCKQVFPTATPTPIISATPTPSQNNCRAVNKVINVTPEGGMGTCHNIQQAIDAIDGEWYTIRLAAGEYYPTKNSDYSLKIINKKKITIEGDLERDPSVVKIYLSDHIGGFLFDGSDGTLMWLQIIGKTTNGIINIRNSPIFSISRAKIVDTGANTIQIDNSGNIFIRDSEFASSAVAIYPRGVNGVNKVTLTNNIIGGAQIGIESSNSNGEAKGNIIKDFNETGILINDETSSWNIVNNTIAGNKNIQNGAIINKNSTFSNNIITAFGVTDTATSNTCCLKITHGSDSDFHNNKIRFNLLNNGVFGKTFCGENCPGGGHCRFAYGEQGNIAEDPLLIIPDYCLSPFSPAIGKGENGVDIGAGNRCSSTSCPLKSKGDANCDNLIGLSDFFAWRDEFLKYSISIIPPTGGWKSDFDGNEKIELADFFIWRRGYLSTR